MRGKCGREGVREGGKGGREGREGRKGREEGKGGREWREGREGDREGRREVGKGGGDVWNDISCLSACHVYHMTCKWTCSTGLV